MNIWILLITVINLLSFAAYYLIRRAIKHFTKSQLLTVGTEQEPVIMNRTYRLLFLAYQLMLLLVAAFSYYIFLS